MAKCPWQDAEGGAPVHLTALHKLKCGGSADMLGRCNEDIHKIQRENFQHDYNSFNSIKMSLQMRSQKLKWADF